MLIFFQRIFRAVLYRLILLILLFSRRRIILEFTNSPRQFIGQFFKKTAKPEAFQGISELEDVCRKTSPLFLHFGCGPRILKGWVNIDLQYTTYDSIMVYFKEYMDYFNTKVYPQEIQGGREDFFIFDVTKYKIPAADNSVDLIFHEDFLEHLDQKDQFLFLAETFRVLKKGAIHRINTPDLEFAMQNYAKGSGSSGIPVDNWDIPAHKNILTRRIIKEMAEVIGYAQTLFTEHNASSARELPYEYRPGEGRSPKINFYVDLVK